jgi:hypothetical protein
MEVNGVLHAPGERAPGTHCIRDWVGPGAGLDALEKRKSLVHARNRTLAVQPITRRYTDRHVLINVGSRDNSVGIATGYGLGGRGVGVRVPVGARFFFSHSVHMGLWCPPSLLFNGYCGLFPRA